MRQLVLFALIIPLIGTGCSSPDARAGAVRVEVTYSFKAGCITVRARDASAPERETSDEVEVLGRGPSTVRFAVFRKEDWGRTLEITTAAREQSCQGPVVDEQVSTVELQESRVEPLIVTLEAPDTDGDGYMPTASGGTDCDDGNGEIRPSAAEVCDTRDNDCDGSTNEGVGPNWYPDNDGDTFGDKSATPRVSCDEPPGIIPYVQNNSDCQDSNATIFPRASAGPETRCDNEDDDCDGTVDDGFEAKGTACSSPCAGEYICNPSRTALTCNAPTPVSYHVDADGDGAGAQGGAVSVCPGTGTPPGRVDNSNDCDDEDPYRKGGGSEVCDSRDNTCDTQIDEGNVCTGKGWKVSGDGALTGGGRDWQTVAVGPGGLPVWIAGLGGSLAVRTVAEQAFTSRDGHCSGRNWRSAWVRPSDGHVFLVADDGYMAQHTGTACGATARVSTTNDLTGIVGFESGATTTLYVVDNLGRLYVWTPGGAVEDRYNLYPPIYYDIHGLSSTQLVAVGGLETDPNAAFISGYPGVGNESAVTLHTVNNLAGNTGSVRAVWMHPANLAYAVGDSGLVLKMVGATSWDRISAPTGATAANFTSVGVLDAHSIYVTDEGGRIWLRTATRWVDTPLYDTDKPLRDIAVTSRMDIWAVGDDGRVLHFAE